MSKKAVVRKNKALRFFNELEKLGYKPYDIKYGDGYFIFDKGTNGVVHFKLRGFRNWLFGLWITNDEQHIYELESEFDKHSKIIQKTFDIEFFWQFQRDINKFKPAASGFSFKLYSRDLNGDSNLNVHRVPNELNWEVRRALEFTRKHSTIARYSESIEFEPYFKSLKMCLYYDWVDIRTWFRDNVKPFWFIFRMKTSRYFKEVEIKDCMKDTDFIIWPRWEIYFIPKDKYLTNRKFTRLINKDSKYNACCVECEED